MNRKLTIAALAAFALLVAAYLYHAEFGPGSKQPKTVPGWACGNSLRQIRDAKNAMAMELNLTNGTVITEQELARYCGRPDAKLPTCPRGGTYTIGPIGTVPVCSLPEHRYLSEELK
jgi:hypothetical protein